MSYVVVSVIAVLLGAVLMCVVQRRRRRLEQGELVEQLARQALELEQASQALAQSTQKVADLDYRLRSCQRDLAAQQRLLTR